MTIEPYEPVLIASAIGLGACGFFGLRLTLSARGALGSVRTKRGAHPLRTVLVLVALLGTASLVGWSTLSTSPIALVALGLGLVAASAAPNADLEVLGEHGVQRGALVRSFAAVEEWRVVGEHLRFRDRGRWHAVRIASDDAARLRSALQTVAPERESALR